MGASEVLFLVFLVLKLVGTIGWSWWWITAPLWIGYSIIFVFFVFFLLGRAILK